MTIKGRLRSDQMTLAQFSIDWMKPLPAIKILAALTDSKTGVSRAWIDGQGVQWSEKTKEALKALQAALEEDLAAAHFDEVAYSGGSSIVQGAAGVQLSDEGGLGEHLGVAGEPPSV